jgi:putative restriction endonuclease
VSHDDRVVNGIALCPNMHRAFDRGLLSISDDYRILVSPHFTEDENHPYSLRKLEGKAIHKPGAEKYLPHREHIEWHRSKVFRQ